MHGSRRRVKILRDFKPHPAGARITIYPIAPPILIVARPLPAGQPSLRRVGPMRVILPSPHTTRHPAVSPAPPPQLHPKRRPEPAAHRRQRAPRRRHLRSRTEINGGSGGGEAESASPAGDSQIPARELESDAARGGAALGAVPRGIPPRDSGGTGSDSDPYARPGAGKPPADGAAHRRPARLAAHRTSASGANPVSPSPPSPPPFPRLPSNPIQPARPQARPTAPGARRARWARSPAAPSSSARSPGEGGGGLRGGGGCPAILTRTLAR